MMSKGTKQIRLGKVIKLWAELELRLKNEKDEKEQEKLKFAINELAIFIIDNE